MLCHIYSLTPFLLCEWGWKMGVVLGLPPLQAILGKLFTLIMP